MFSLSPAFGAPAPQKIVLQGAELLESSTPKVFDGDLRNLPRAPVEPSEPAQEPGNTKSLQGPILNFAGQGYTGAGVPDTTGDVGLHHYVQMVNGPQGAVFTVYNKADGSVAAGPIRLGSLGVDDCTSGAGAGTVLYDQLADRWLLSEFSTHATFEFAVQCFYISRTSDPVAGGWFAYRHSTFDAQERPNFGVWPDGYYQSSYRPNPEYPSAPQDPTVSVLERSQMLVGGVARGQSFHVPRLAGFGRQELIPADADGDSPPPAGAPNPFMRHRDDEVHNPGANDPDLDFLEIWEFHVDWTTPANSTLTGPINIPVAELDSDLCGLSSSACFPQPGGPALDPRREQIMHRLQYRNFGTHQTLVGNFVTDVDGTDHGGIRWFELRNTGGGWGVHQEGTLAPDAHHRWLGSAAMDGQGNLGIGYSVASATLYPSIRFAARLAGDTLGTLQDEVPVIAGTAANAFSDWGRTAALSVDPVDDDTFWFTTMYSPASSWATRIATFRLCDPPGAPVIGSATAAADNRIDITWSNGNPPSDSFNVFRADGTCASPGPFDKIAGAVPGFAYQDTNLSGGSTYAYRVTGLLNGCDSGPSSCVDATATGVCTLPLSFAGLDSATNQGTPTCGVALAWTAATPGCGGPVIYNVYRSTTSGFTPGPGNLIAANLSGTSYIDTSPLISGTTYYYVVRAVDTANGVGESNNVQRSAVPTGPMATTFIETFEGPGGFDNPEWTHGSLYGSTDWVLSADRSQTPTHSWFSASQDYYSDRALVSPPFAAQPGTTLSFWHTYEFHPLSDGGTLEISTDDGGTGTYVHESHLIAGGYNCPLGGYGIPISDAKGWCGGTLGAMTEVKVDLGFLTGVANTRLRWHQVDDVNPNHGIGWYVDSVTLQAPSACSSLPPTPLGFYTLTPCRLVDTRNPDGPLGGPALQPSAERTFVLTGSCGVPPTAKALSLNLTVTETDAPGYLTLFPGDIARPFGSSINFAADQTRANNAIVPLAVGGSGELTVFNAATGSVHFILDVNGYFAEVP